MQGLHRHFRQGSNRAVALAARSGLLSAYIRFNGDQGAVGPIHIAVNGQRPLDDFSCYPGICRYGDYSASNFFNGRLYFATEYVHTLTNVAAGARSNWATRVWSVPQVTSAG